MTDTEKVKGKIYSQVHQMRLCLLASFSQSAVIGQWLRGLWTCIWGFGFFCLFACLFSELLVDYEFGWETESNGSAVSYSYEDSGILLNEVDTACTVQPLPQRREERSILDVVSCSPQLSNVFVTFTAAGCTMGCFESVIVIVVLCGDTGQSLKGKCKSTVVLLVLNAFENSV